jgi:toxin FitB
MILLFDTNIISELASPSPSEAVLDWISQQEARDLHTSAVTIHELRYGIEKLPAGKRRNSLDRSHDRLLVQFFPGRILPLDVIAADASGKVEAAARLAGRPIGQGDCMIAGIAISKRATVVTRNVKHFAETGVSIVNPWGV